VPGIARLGIPPQWSTDAGLGVATQGGAKEKRERTALPSGLATAATWDPELAHRAGAMIGAEARASGFNIMLAGSVNLVREPRNGRNFEYAGEDPLLAGMMVGAQIKGIESNHIISTIKHFALNDQETNRNTLNVNIDRAQARMSDLLAFQIAIEQSNPGSVMCSYNRVWGDHACESAYLLSRRAAQDWGWNGFVMSDWGATHSTARSRDVGPRPAVRLSIRRPAVLRRAAAEGRLQRRAQGETAHRDGAAHRAHACSPRVSSTTGADRAPSTFKAHAHVTRAGAEQGSRAAEERRLRLLPLSQAHCAHRRGRRSRGQGRARRRRLLAGVLPWRQRGSRLEPKVLAGSDHVLPLVTRCAPSRRWRRARRWPSTAARIGSRGQARRRQRRGVVSSRSGPGVGDKR
jgi:beta-glucosidase